MCTSQLFGGYEEEGGTGECLEFPEPTNGQDNFFFLSVGAKAESNLHPKIQMWKKFFVVVLFCCFVLSENSHLLFIL